MSDWFDAESYVSRALELFERGRWTEAEAELRKALALNPDQPEWHYNLGLTLEAAGRDDEAYLSYERASELLGDEIQPALSAALAAARLNRLEDSNRWLDRVLRIEPKHEAAHATRIDNLVRARRHDEALTAFYVAVQELEESAICYAAIAESLIQTEAYAKAEWCLKEALRISPTIPRVRAQLGRVFAATDRPHRALQMYLRELRDDPGNIEALLDYGDLLVETGRLPDAAEKFRRVLELQPAHAEAHMRLGEIALAMGRIEQAHLEFELVLKLEPGYPDARVLLAETLLKRGRITDAQAYLSAELERIDQLRDDDESQAPAESDEHGEFGDLSRLGEVLLLAALPAEASQVLALAIERGDDRIGTLRHLALAHFRSGNRSAGIAISRRAIRLDPRCVESMHNLALAALEDGRLRVASGWIRRGLGIAPNDEELRRLRIRLWIAATAAFIKRVVRRS